MRAAVISAVGNIAIGTEIFGLIYEDACGIAGLKIRKIFHPSRENGQLSADQATHNSLTQGLLPPCEFLAVIHHQISDA